MHQQHIEPIKEVILTYIDLQEQIEQKRGEIAELEKTSADTLSALAELSRGPFDFGGDVYMLRKSRKGGWSLRQLNTISCDD